MLRHRMELFYNESTGRWYDPRAPMVGRYAKQSLAGYGSSRPSPKRTGPRTMYIHNMYARQVAGATAKALRR